MGTTDLKLSSLALCLVAFVACEEPSDDLVAGSTSSGVPPATDTSSGAETGAGCEPTPCACPDGSMGLSCPPLMPMCGCGSDPSGGSSGDTTPSGCSIDIALSGALETTISSAMCPGGAAVGQSFALSFGDVALLVATGGGEAGDFDTDGVEVTFEEEAGGRVVDFTFDGCTGIGSWSGGGSVSTLSIAGDIDCSAVLPTARNSETGEDLSEEFATLQMAPFSFEWT